MPSGVKWIEIPSFYVLIGRNRCFFSWIEKGGGKILPVGGKCCQLTCEFPAEVFMVPGGRLEWEMPCRGARRKPGACLCREVAQAAVCVQSW